MIVIELTCTYCGKKWQVKPLSKYDVEYALRDLKCSHCGDKKVTAEDITTSKVDYYGDKK